MNKVILMGRLTKDPEYSDKSTPRTTFTLAVNRRYAAQGQQPLADFPQIVCWRNTAEFAHKYLTKGMRVVVEGSLQTRSYDAQDGSKRFATEVVAENIEFCESRREGAKNASESTFVELPDNDQLPF